MATDEQKIIIEPLKNHPEDMKGDNESPKILITGARGFLGKYVDDRLRSRFEHPEEHIFRLGRSPHNDIMADLTREVPEITCAYDRVVHLVGTCIGGDFEALNVAATRNLLKALNANPPRRLLYVSSTEVYGREEGTGLTEGTIVDPATACGRTKLEAEHLLQQWCADKGVALTILRCQYIVGTGMQGFLRRMVNRIYRGLYQNVADETAAISVVHATDVARALCDLEIDGVFNFTDGFDTPLARLADALGVRMKNKRVYVIKPSRARRIAALGRILPWMSFNKAALAARYRSLTFSADKLLSQLDWKPSNVVEYLRTHDYEQDNV